jgi:undecaprenyl-diphosphatase
MAIFISITFKEFIGKWKYVVYFWAASVAYGQVYVGVHYPLDVIGGALLGAMIGWLTASLYKNYFALLTPEDTIEETRARMQAFKKSL